METFLTKHNPLLIAEIGGNHEGSFEYAKKLCHLAIESPAHVIKFQLYTGGAIVNEKVDPTRFNHFSKFELSKKEHVFLAEMCREAGKTYNASVWDLSMLEWIDKYLKFYKIGSGDLTAISIIEKFASREKPIILSTGLSTISEIEKIVKIVKDNFPIYRNSEMLGVMQCTSMYPIPDNEANLEVLEEFKKIEGITLGYSDHTAGSKALIYSYIKGAQILEFHFTDTRDNKSFRDHSVSLTLEEVKCLQKELEIAKELMGNGIKSPTKSELDNNHHVSFRRGLYFKNDLKKGHKISKGDLTVLRPSIGISAINFYEVIGKTLNRDIEKLEPLKHTYFE